MLALLFVLPTGQGILPLCCGCTQIRLHLHYLGHPIFNDELYGPGSTAEDGEPSPLAARAAVLEAGRHRQLAAEASAFCPAAAEGPPGTAAAEGPPGTAALSRLCPWCASGGEDAAAFSPNQLRREGIWLHALRYRGATWDYEAEPPAWARGLR